MTLELTTPEEQIRSLSSRDESAPFGLYLHVPFCASRCGYCDFNTYTAGELGSTSSVADWEQAAAQEIEAAADLVDGQLGAPQLDTVFVGGGTPSLVGADILNGLLERIKSTFGLAASAEVTTECNPESTSPEFFEALREGGFTRISLGMQSTASHVLALLDRKHTPGRALEAARQAMQAGFEHVNLDVIYGAPNETDDDLHRTLDDVLSTGVDHVSAYSLIIEEGTALARRVRRGEVPPTVDDVLADRYELLVDRLYQAGLNWYEVSNFAKGASSQCRHNLGYWRDGDWWGIGPGAHSHIAGLRWWNVRHPARYAARCGAGELPVDGAESLSPDDRHLERIMLGLRLVEGLPESAFFPEEAERARHLVERGILSYEGSQGDSARFALTSRGRLLADGAILEVIG